MNLVTTPLALLLMHSVAQLITHSPAHPHIPLIIHTLTHSLTHSTFQQLRLTLNHSIVRKRRKWCGHSLHGNDSVYGTLNRSPNQQDNQSTTKSYNPQPTILLTHSLAQSNKRSFHLCMRTQSFIPTLIHLLNQITHQSVSHLVTTSLNHSVTHSLS